MYTIYLYSLSQPVGLMDNIIGWSIQAHLIQNYDSIHPKPYNYTDGMVLANSQALINTT